MENSDDFMLSGIVGIVKLLWFVTFRKYPVPSMEFVQENSENPENWPLDDIEHAGFLDMLMVRIAAEQLEEPYRSIVLLKVFPDTPSEDKKTDEELVETLLNKHGGNWDKDKFGVYRRRGLYKLRKILADMRKENMENHVLAQSYPDFVMINSNFPTGAVWGIMHNNSSQIDLESRIASIKKHLDSVHNTKTIERYERLHLFPSVAAKWTNSTLNKPTPMSTESFMQRMKDLLIGFKNLIS